MDNAVNDIREFIEMKFLMGQKLKQQDEALFSSGLIDSFGVLELISFLEKRFDILIDVQSHELSQFDSIPKILGLLDTLKKEANRK